MLQTSLTTNSLFLQRWTKNRTRLCTVWCSYVVISAQEREQVLTVNSSEDDDCVQPAAQRRRKFSKYENKIDRIKNKIRSKF